MKIEITTIIVAIIGSGVLNSIINYMIQRHQKKIDSKSNIEKALRLIMKDRLRFLCAVYIQQGWIYEDELEDIIAMHNCYHTDLNGNGYLDELIKKVSLLQIKGKGI